MRTLVLYYTNTGHTRTVAEALAKDMGAELGEVTCEPYLRWYGALALGWDIFTRHRSRIEVLTPPHAHYDLVVVGGPVWAGRAAPPVLCLLAGHGGEIVRAGLFVTCGGTSQKYPPEPALAEMGALVPGRVIETAVFREADIASGAYRGAVAEFAHTLIAKATITAAVRELKRG